MSRDAVLLAGETLYAAIQAEIDATVPRSLIPGREDCYQSEPLCALHATHARRGIAGAELVKTIYGWGVRYDSGLQNWNIIASPRGALDGSFEHAARYAREWVAEAPGLRYAWVRQSSMNRE